MLKQPHLFGLAWSCSQLSPPACTHITTSLSIFPSKAEWLCIPTLQEIMRAAYRAQYESRKKRCSCFDDLKRDVFYGPCNVLLSKDLHSLKTQHALLFNRLLSSCLSDFLLLYIQPKLMEVFPNSSRVIRSWPTMLSTHWLLGTHIQSLYPCCWLCKDSDRLAGSFISLEVRNKETFFNICETLIFIERYVHFFL